MHEEANLLCHNGSAGTGLVVEEGGSMISVVVAPGLGASPVYVSAGL